MNAAHLLPVKLSCADETHRAALAGDPPSFDALCLLVTATFPQTAARFALVYTDDEGDVVTLASALELVEALRVFEMQHKTLHVRVLPQSQPPPTPTVLLQAVDELSSTLARLASGTRDTFTQQSAFIERSRASVVSSAKHTRAFLASARKELAQRLWDVHARLSKEMERRRSRTGSSSEDGLDAQEDDSAGVEMEARQSEQVDRERAEDVEAVDNTNNDDEEEEETVTDESVGATVVVRRQELRAEAEEDEMLDASDAETVACSSSDDDNGDMDDMDDEDAEWAVLPAVWTADVALVRTILPHVHVDDCVAALQAHGGDLEAAINELTGPRVGVEPETACCLHSS